MFLVRMQTDVRDAGQVFGEFAKREQAERCVIALASRPDVQSAIIEEKK